MAPLHIGDLIKVRDKKDGRPYECKVVKVTKKRVMVHFKGWNKSRDEWLALDDQRIMSGSAGSSRAVSLGPRTPPPQGRTSVERQIDELYSTMCSQPVGHSINLHKPSPPSKPANKRKRSVGPEGNSPSENARKHSLVNPTNERSANDGSSLPAEVVHPNVPASLLPGEQLSSLPLPTLEPLEASGATAASLVVGDQEVSASVSVSLTNCGLCQVSIDQPKVRCTTCDKFFHDDIMQLVLLIIHASVALLDLCYACLLSLY